MDDSPKTAPQKTLSSVEPVLPENSAESSVNGQNGRKPMHPEHRSGHERSTYPMFYGYSPFGVGYIFYTQPMPCDFLSPCTPNGGQLEQLYLYLKEYFESEDNSSDGDYNSDSTRQSNQKRARAPKLQPSFDR